jgi:cell division protein FtsW
MAADALRAFPPAGGAIGYQPTGRRSRGATSAIGRGSGATRITGGTGRSDGKQAGGGRSGGRVQGGRSGAFRQAVMRNASDALGPVVEGRSYSRRTDESRDAREARDDRVGRDARDGRDSREVGRRPSKSTPLVEAAWTGERHGPDVTVLAVVLSLTALGILMVFSSSAMDRVSEGKSAYETVGPQLLYAALGVLAMLGVILVPYRLFRLVALPALVLGAVLLALLFVSPWSQRLGGSAQWLRIPGLPMLQPGEFVKLAVILYLASWMQRRGTAVRGIASGFLPFGIIVGPFVLAIFLTPDMGSAGVLGVTAVVMYFVAGGSLLSLGALTGLGVVGALGAATFLLREYQVARLGAFIDPFKDAAGAGYQTAQGLVSLGMGGLTGTGLGDRAAAGGIALPNAHNDYIFAVVGQETGFLGASLVIIGFMVLAWKGAQISRNAPTTFGALVAGGITAWLCVQAFINIGVVVALLPVTGITLPFVSAGGSSLIVSLVAVGILLSVSRETVAAGGWVDASGDRGRRHGRAHLPGPRRRSIPLGAP